MERLKVLSLETGCSGGDMVAKKERESLESKRAESSEEENEEKTRLWAM